MEWSKHDSSGGGRSSLWLCVGRGKQGSVRCVPQACLRVQDSSRNASRATSHHECHSPGPWRGGGMKVHGREGGGVGRIRVGALGTARSSRGGSVRSSISVRVKGSGLVG